MLFLVNPFWITSAKYLTAGVGAFVVGGQAAAFSRALGLPAAAGAIVLSGKAAGLLYNRRVDAEAAAFALTGMQAQFIGAGRIMADPAAFVLSGQAANLRSARVLSAELGSFTLGGKDAALLFGKTLPADRGVFAISGNEAGLLRSLIASAGPGTFNVAGQDAGLLRSLMLTASSGAYVLSGQAAALVRRFVLSAAPGGFTLAGQDAGLNRGRSLVASPAGFVLAGQDAGLTYTPGVVSSLSYLTTVFGGSAVTMPAIQQHDIAVAMSFAQSGSSTTPVQPAGFTSIHVGAAGSRRCTCYAKILDGTESGASIPGMDATSEGIALLILRPNGAVTTINSGSWGSTVSAADPGSVSIAASGQPVPLARIGFIATAFGTPTFSSGAFDTNDGGTGNSADMRVGVKLFSSAPANDIVDQADNGSGNGVMGGWLSVA